MGAATLFDKIWDRHVVTDLGDGYALLHISRHLMHDGGSSAFKALKEKGYPVRNPELTFATFDHVISTLPGRTAETNPALTQRLYSMRTDAKAAGVRLFDLGEPGQGIVHVIGPELGLTLPGTLLVCGDSHTCTHGGMGALAFGIGSSEVVHVLATQTIVQRRPKRLRATFEGTRPPGVTPKDMILHLIGVIGAAGGTGYAVEYAGSAIRELDIEGRLTICNLSIELGAKCGMIAPDETTFASSQRPSVRAHRRCLGCRRRRLAHAAQRSRRGIRQGGCNRRQQDRPADHLGHQPRARGRRRRPHPRPGNGARRGSAQRVAGGARLHGPQARRADRGNARRLGLHRLLHQQPHLGSARGCGGGERAQGGGDGSGMGRAGLRERQAAGGSRGLDQVFKAAGFEWREPGCSMCLAMNNETVPPGQRSVSTSNSNFVGRQGPGARTHLASPAMAAAAALAGHIVDVRAI